MKKNIVEKLDRSLIIFMQESGIKAGILLGSIGIQIGADISSLFRTWKTVLFSVPLKMVCSMKCAIPCSVSFSFLVPAAMKTPKCDSIRDEPVHKLIPLGSVKPGVP